MLSTIFVSNFTPSSVIILADKNREKVLYKTIKLQDDGLENLFIMGKSLKKQFYKVSFWIHLGKPTFFCWFWLLNKHFGNKRLT